MSSIPACLNNKTIISKDQGVQQYNNAAYPKQQEEEETPPNRTYIFTSKRRPKDTNKQ